LSSAPPIFPTQWMIWKVLSSLAFWWWL
jgi:hypothetical protein